ncbi:MAG: hypothetical protein AAF411_14715 [Myxococcota bacterium]
MECSNCGAALKIEEGKAFAVCEYCGTHNRVRGDKTLMAESAFARPASEPGPEEREREEPSEPPSERRPSSPFGALRVLPLIAVIAGACFLAFRPRQAEQLVVAAGEHMSAWYTEAFGPDEPETLVLEGDETLTFSGRARGMNAAAQIATSSCAGLIDEDAPLHVITVRPGTLHLDVRGTGDPTLTVRTSEGRWLCDDDGGEDMMPRIVETVPAGAHEVWIGRYGYDEVLDFELSARHEAAAEAPSEAQPAQRRRPRRRRSRPAQEAPAENAGMNAQATDEVAPSRAAAPSNAAIPSPFIGDGRTPMNAPTTGRGLVSVNTEPWSLVRVNGHLMGQTPRSNMVVAVGARVEVQLEGEGRWIPLTVTIVPGETQQVFRRFP